MFDYVAKHKRLAQILLGMIALSFVFFGTYSYFQRPALTPDVATVGGEKITQNEFDDLLREQQDRMRKQMGRNYDPAMFDSPEVRFALVDQLVNQRLLRDRARADRLRVSDTQLQQFIAAIPAFQEDGKFSAERYKLVLAQQDPPIAPAAFEQRLRQDLTLAPLQEPIASGNIAARTSAERYLSLLEQKREVAAAPVDVMPYLKDVKIDDAATRAYYDQNTAAFQIPEQAKVEYVVLSPEALSTQVTVDPAAVRKQYDDNQKQYGQGEERSAAHILVAVKPGASEADKAAAKKKAEDLAAQVRANPAKFAELARANSEDPGSAQAGGDLGSFARGAMVKPFEDAVYAGKAGDIVGPVQTDFGWHVIRITDVKASQIKPFDEVKGQIEADLKRVEAQKKFAAAADQFQNLVYEQADSLQPVAKALDVKVGVTPLLSRAQVQQLGLGNAKFVEALFAPASLAAKRNTEAIEVAPNTLIAGRIVEYKPAAPMPYDDVKEEIRRQLTLKAASELAQKAGLEKLALLEQGKSEKDAGVVFGKPVELSRNQAGAGYPPDALVKIFQAPATKLPAYVSAPNERGGLTIYRLSKVTDPAATDEARVKLASTRIGEQLGRELFTAYLASLKAKSDVKINQGNVEKKQ
jgi:peptidyl-prolyl cis-trans isomerase D